MVKHPRYAPSRAFPPYTYVPGQQPHPFSDPLGHSFGQPRPHPPAIDWTTGSASDAFRFALDLFNHGFYWEAHEQWEGLWEAVGRKGLLADFLKGLIHLAAAGVKVREGVPQGVRSHTSRARELFDHVLTATPGWPLHLGIDAKELVQRLQQPELPSLHLIIS